ncbi:hypothetical protein L2E82_09798 [Cichorium intybus]|uniref:Uncharacterized protein n=1 Tax=Cichorium intybus TaxID=13427 RepID=A0ACB9G952_CICIN|nr:hypothetical protein L2E82_09798 [Cichorium intybus]
MVENIFEEEVVGDNATSNSTAFDVLDVFENVDLVMCESVPSPDNLVEEDVVEEAVSDSTDLGPTIPEIIEIANQGSGDGRLCTTIRSNQSLTLGSDPLVGRCSRT